jgi:energy-coupling factor transporter ATP-binding protein EcfA2
MIKAEELTKRRGGRAVVSDVAFRCEPGTVTGFLGPNGAAKTTTMRMLVGLSAPDSGQALFGGRYRDLSSPGRRVGVLLDASAQHAGRRGREALAVSARTGARRRAVPQLPGGGRSRQHAVVRLRPMSAGGGWSSGSNGAICSLAAPVRSAESVGKRRQLSVPNGEDPRCNGDLRSLSGSVGNPLKVGETGFEPATARPPAGCATRLRHSPWLFCQSGRRESNPP